MIYTKKAFFLFAITFAGSLCAISSEERELLLAEAAEKQALLRELVEKIFAQDALIQSYMNRVSTKINAIAELEERLLGAPAEETRSKIPQEIKDSFTGSSIQNKTPLHESIFNEKTALQSRSLVKLYIVHTAVYEFVILIDLVKEWESTKNSLDQILAQLDHPITR